MTEYMNRPPGRLTIIGKGADSSRQTEIYEVKFDRPDASLGSHCFMEIGPTAGLTDPNNIVPVRVYSVKDAWDASPRVDVIEEGFLCTEDGYARIFG
jgi:hypothetical protein